MTSPQHAHVVLSGSIEHALLVSASVDLPRTRRQLLVIAIEGGLQRYDNETVMQALRHLVVNGSLQVSLGHGRLRIYCLTPQGKQVLQDFRERPA